MLLHEGAGDMKTAEGGGVRALTGVRDRRNRILSAVFDLYSPLTLLKLKKSYISKCSYFLLLFNEKNTEAKIDFFYIIFDENIHIFLV